MVAKTLMVQGTASSVGKSLLVTALCRIFKQRGFRVAPFKSQNMSLNSYVTYEGLEMGRAQVSQARAAGIEPSALMNPILLKPCTNRKSQVIVNGKVRCTLSAQEYFARKEEFLPDIKKAFTTLASAYDIIVIEGAGSPAEINLAEKDFVNMGMADIANAPVLLVGDIDRGGVFASLYGTVQLLPKEHQDRIKGLIINKFRGDLSILSSGLSQLENLVSKPILGVLPFEKFAIDEEDSLTERFSYSSAQNVVIAVPQLPRMSNFTDFAVFDSFSECSLVYSEDPEQISQADIILLPGSKNTIEDLHWLNTTGIGHSIRSASDTGTPVIGICGGFQMLGKVIHDPLGVEGTAGSVEGLGLLDMETCFQPDKYTVQATHTVLDCPGILKGLTGIALQGYEIHMGHSTYGRESIPFASCTIRNKHQAKQKSSRGAVEQESTYTEQEYKSGVCNESGNVIGTYLHGLFDNLAFTQHIVHVITQRKKQLSDRHSSQLHPKNATSKKELSCSTKERLFPKEEISSFVTSTPCSTENTPSAEENTSSSFSDLTLYSQIQEREYDRLAAMVEKYLDMEAIIDILNKDF